MIAHLSYHSLQGKSKFDSAKIFLLHTLLKFDFLQIEIRIYFFFLQMIFMFLLVGIVSGVPLQEPLQVTSLKGITIKGKHPPIGPGTDQGVYNVDKFEGDVQLPHKVNILNIFVSIE